MTCFLRKRLLINILPKEELVLFKSITGRARDYEDIETILTIEKTIDWNRLVNEVINQKKNNSWILFDLEEVLQELKTKFFIKHEIFDMLYAAEK